MDKYRELLTNISEKLEADLPHRQYTGYNIFDVLEIEDKEVIMCRFLADLLCPEGKHGCGTLFLKSFLEDVLGELRTDEVLLQHTSVIKEYGIDDLRRIDIVICNSVFFLPIEVKIYAPEQPGQCWDYYECAVKKDCSTNVIYLTRFGTAPSEHSRRSKDSETVLSLDHIKRISWTQDIVRWLLSLVDALSDPIRFIVLQYLDAIYEFADGREKRMEQKSVDILSESKEYFQAGLQIEKTMKAAKLRLLRSVFDDFRVEMDKIAVHYGLRPEMNTGYYSYEEKRHDKFYDNENISTFPGLNYIVEKAHFQNSQLQMWFRIEVEYQLFAGFTLFDTSLKKENGYNGYQVDEITKNLVDEAGQYLDKAIMNPVDWWLAWCYPNGKSVTQDYEDVPNFKYMNVSAVELVDTEKRKKYVADAVKVFEEKLLGYLV